VEWGEGESSLRQVESKVNQPLLSQCLPPGELQCLCSWEGFVLFVCF
jgi:hypothetical protein